MKKIALITMLGLSSLLIQPVAFADGVDIEDSLTEFEEVSVLSIDDVIDRGMERNSMLLLLQYQMEIIDNQQTDTIRDYHDLKDDLEDAENAEDELVDTINQSNLETLINSVSQEITTIEGDITALKEELAVNDKSDIDETIEFLEKENEILKKELEKLQKALDKAKLEENKAELEKGLETLQAQIEAIEDAINQMQLAIEKINIGEFQLTYEYKEAQLIVEQMLESTYIGLLTTKDQIEFMQLGYEQTEKEIASNKLRMELGLTSTFELEKSKRELTKQEEELERAKKDYQRELAKFSLDIGIEYDPKIRLQDIDFKTKDFTRYETDKLIKNSYQYRKAVKDLELAEIELEDLEDQSGVSRYKEKQAELAVDMEKEKIRQLKLDLEKGIETLYYELDKAYEDIINKNRDLKNAKIDNERLSMQYELGLVSKFQYEQASMQIEQAEFELKMAKNNYYMVKEQVKAMHEGLVQVNTSL